jgi:dTDP-4-dehydro-6-deoxy-alpha-D-glucopyranose 2,3-dehydratase
MSAPVLEPLRSRDDAGLARRLAVSAATTDNPAMPTAQVEAWLADRARAHAFEVHRIPFADLDGWAFREPSGDLAHRSGRFFSVVGLRAKAPDGPVPDWYQPIINQPEVGILGIVAREIGGVLHFLMQAKMEPGNPNLVQLSPTVQATRSNYSGVHRGAPVRFLEHFVGRHRGRVLVDVLQSEHGAWFYRKRNRNMVVETRGHPGGGDEFCWLTLGQIHELMARDNVVNMDSRTVLSCLPQAEVPGRRPAGRFSGSLAASRDPDAGALSTTPELLSWFIDRRVECSVDVGLVPLAGLPGWEATPDEIVRPDRRFFRVVAVDVRAGSREVPGWGQPLFEPFGLGVAAFVVREFGGVLHALVNARAEAGFSDGVELGPTVQCVPWNHEGSREEPRFLREVLAAPEERVRYRCVHSEEGGRFFRAQSEYLVVEALDADGFDAEPPPDYAWATLGQLSALLRHSQYVNVQARTLIACLNALR